MMQSADLLALAERDTCLRRVAGTGGGEWAGPCPFCGGRDRFRVQPYAKPRPVWYCRGCGGGRWHDALDYVARREGLDLRRADDFRRARELLGSLDDLPRRAPPPIPPSTVTGRWQDQARHVIAECVTALWASSGERARAWLHARGLTDETLRRWRIGYLPGTGYRDIAGLHVPCGIVIPCEVSGTVWYIKVRRATGTPKYLMVQGGVPALFGSDEIPARNVVVLCEGEFDAMLLNQQAGDMAAAATMGGATVTRGFDAMWRWGHTKCVIIAYDNDEAGKNGAARMVSILASARIGRLPVTAKDITDYHNSGGDLRAWLATEIIRLFPAARDVTPADDVTDDVTPADDVTGDVTSAPPTGDVTDDVTPADDVTGDVTSAPPTGDVTDDVTPADDVTDDVTPADDVTDDVTPADDVTDDVTTPLDPAVLAAHMAALPPLPPPAERNWRRITAIVDFHVIFSMNTLILATPLPGGRFLASWRAAR